MISLFAGLLAATGASPTYGESLLDGMNRRHPEISRVHVTAANGQGAAIQLDRRWMGSSRSSETGPLLDANGNEIGLVLLESRCPGLPEADKIVSELSRRIYSSASLAEPDPFVAEAIRASYAQAMIDEALESDPGLITIAFHVKPPGRTSNMIVASSFGRIGKPGDADDEQVIREEKTRLEITNNGKRVAIELPLLDARGSVIGALSTSFRSDLGTKTDELEKRAMTLRDSLARRTPSLRALFRHVTASRQVGILHTCSS